ncbi:magnesium-translocating P-type ATPase [Amycolatopsis rubida]|uniref:Magnesium-transporting ATPase, P-type 1 n=1 Tax=Amycolatopsis rubida TaxID=112413 RepID=A0ABX0C2S9_9PSEU|nr:MULTISPECIES: magnesium-translocating P-type ATPase [Amycolatopsis]MYW94362.1 magnesium-translocating P-type ATPase [Amycolatopsis rubida]NEC59351.1 magnesium-translocating P-type ATPase [Amycolatopsis rubida]OAP26847.1 Magnesium-transporting ATPase, P-type 1 [Amycolatopsis sp. M39]
MTRFPALRAHGDAPVLTLFRNLGSSPKGLTENEAAERLRRFGDNRIDGTDRAPVRVWAAARSPFVALLTALGVVFAGVGDIRGAVTVGVMVALSIGLRFWQQSRSERAISAVRDQITTTVTVRRRAAAEFPGSEREVPTADLVPGDVVLLGPGDVIPADVRIVAAKDFVVDQSALSGEALPVAKRAPQPGKHEEHELVETPALGFAGTSVVGGTATAVVAATGSETYFGALAKQSAEPRAESSFDAGVRRVGWTLVRFMLVMVPIVLVVNGTVTGDWAQAGMFAVAVAVGLTPEMLPVIVTTNLARGAAALSRRQVIVKRLNAIQDLAAMDVLCVDKTGTLTEDRIAYAHSVDYSGSPDGEAAEYAGLAVRFQTDRHDRLDEAIETLFDGEDDLVADALFTGVAEIGFDHARRRASVVVRRGSEHLLISKGDPDEILPRCGHARRDGVVTEFDDAARIGAEELVRAYAEHGMRVLAVAAREVSAGLGGFDETDENEMILVGFVGFVDPVRDGVVNAVKALGEQGVALKVLTGDNRHVAARVADSAGIPVGEVVLGRRVEAADDAELREIVKDTTVFAKLTPAHKARVVTALRENGCAVGFVGDGVNDVTALRTADVGIAPDTATDAAKEAADLVLLDRDLGVLARGVAEGRRTLGNTLKYVSITAASNFGNVLSVLAASAFLPFLPILPIQLVVSNLLYDLAQLALAWDRVDDEYLSRPRRWDARGLTGFMLVFGPLSSLFDLATFAVLWHVFGAGADPLLFQTGWFVEGLLSQLLVVLVLRGRGTSPRASRPVVLATAAAALVGLLVPLSPLAGPLRMQALPAGYLLWLVLVLAGYALAAHIAKRGYARRRAWW